MQNGNSLLARGRRSGGLDGVRALRHLRNAAGRDCVHLTRNGLYSPDIERMGQASREGQRHAPLSSIFHIDSRLLHGVTTEKRVRIKTLERHTLSLRQANESLRKASTYFEASLGDLNIVCRAAGRNSIAHSSDDRLH